MANMMTKTSGMITVVILIIATLSFSSSPSSAASLEGVVSGPQQELYSDLGTQYWAHTPVHVRRSVQYCGTRLVDAIRNLCKGNTYAALSRRSDPALASLGSFESESHDHESGSNAIDFPAAADTYFGSNGENYWDGGDSTVNDIDLMWPHNGKSLAFKILTESAAHQRFRRTIIDECCKKPCTAMEMVKYCGSSRRSGTASRSS